MTLRPYQEQAIVHIRNAMRTSKRIVLVLPTGTGKTRVAAEIIRMSVAKGKRVVFLAHRIELIAQTARTLRGLGLDCGIISASSTEPENSKARIQVASVQTLIARGLEATPDADLIIADECHHMAESAEEWSSLLYRWQSAYVVGLTATPERGDGTGLAPIFDSLVLGLSVREATEGGHLVPCDVIGPDHQLNSGELAQPPLEAYLEHGGERQGFLFARNVSEAQKYDAEFNARGISCRCIHANTPAAERAMALSDFRAGRVRILSNVYVMTEGIDLPMSSVCILARGAGSAGIYLQMVGRILRIHPGKRDALLIDLSGATHQWGAPDDDREFKLDGMAIIGVKNKERICAVCTIILPATGYPCPQCGYCPENSNEPVEITNDPLVKFCGKRAEGPEQRWSTALWWYRQCRSAGRKPTSIFYKWRAVYGCDLPGAWYRALISGMEKMP